MKKIILPFMIVFSQSAFAGSSSDMIMDIVNQYKMLGKNKALVVAVDDDKYAAGWGFKFPNTKRAIAKAMKGCQKSRLNYQVHAECVVYMINDKPQVTNNSVEETSVAQNTNNSVQEVEEEVVISSSNDATSNNTTSSKVVHVDSAIEAVVEADEQMIMSVD